MKIKVLNEIIDEYETKEKIYYKEEYGDMLYYFCIIFNENSDRHSRIEVTIANNGGAYIDFEHNVHTYGHEYLIMLEQKQIPKKEFIEAYRLVLSKIESNL